VLTGIDVHGVLAVDESFSLGRTVGWSSGGRKNTQGHEGSEGLERNHCANWSGEKNEVKAPVICDLTVVG
jgi:hypothetical protein